MRFAIALITGKILVALTRLYGSGGTALPGLVALVIDRSFLKHAFSQIPEIVVVAGTNGKTTTARMIGSVLSAANRQFIANRAGSNLLRGVASTIIHRYKLGQPLLPTALLEIDEASLPLLLSQIHPTVIVLLNLFRDQLDRYGEIDTIRTQWQQALEEHPTTTLVLNADDPGIAHLGHNRKGSVLWFGIADRSHATTQAIASDVRFCFACGGPLSYQGYLVSHTGWYRCNKCGFERPTPHVQAERVEVHGLVDSTIMIQTPAGNLTVKVPLPGLYNAVNALAAVTAGIALHIDIGVIAEGLATVGAAFGRTEQLRVGKKQVLLLLMKNPAGLGALTRAIAGTGKIYHALLALNDQLADGTDVSWIWDAPFEELATHLKSIIATGTRTYDLALRIKYTGNDKPLRLITNVRAALEHALHKLPDDEILLIVPTYTALLSIRSALSKRTGRIRHLQEAHHE